ncbi:MAG TPA: oxidoreductase [Candidatus Angelobacter sp.]|nr:oxidoreductase [Candidatus Angelobacter sp.]
MQNRVWFITGARTGFGRAFVEHALERGYNVVAAGRNLSKLDEIVKVAPNSALAVKLDVNDRAQLKDAVSQTMAKFGRVDVLINNAGYGIVGALEETPESELRAQMETNFFGAMAVTQAFLPILRAQKSGAIVNISSMGGQLSFAGFSAYSASKFALEGASEALAQEVKPFGIKVLIVEPGQFRTELAGSAMKHMPELEAYAETVGATRKFAASMHGTQEGDPRKAARAIEQAIDAPNTPLRLQLGEDSVSAIRAHAETLLTEMQQWQRVAADTKVSPTKA